MRTLLAILLTCHCFNVQCQKPDLVYLNKIIKKGICTNESKKCIQNQIKYIKACEQIGDYYYKIKYFKNALKYYLLSADLGVYTDGELEKNEPISLRNKVAAKAGDMYFHGIGVKKNRESAFHLHYRPPVFYSNIEKAKYSKLYFNDTSCFYIAPDKNADSIIFGINPFYILNTTTALFLSKTLDNIQRRMQDDKTLKCQIEITYGMLNLNVVNQSYLQRFLENLKDFLKDNLQDRFSFDLIDEMEGYSYKSLVLPKMSVRIIH